MKRLLAFLAFCLFSTPNYSSAQVKVTLLNDSGKRLENLVFCNEDLGSFEVGEIKIFEFDSLIVPVTISAVWNRVQLIYPTPGPMICGTPPATKPHPVFEAEIRNRIWVNLLPEGKPVLMLRSLELD